MTEDPVLLVLVTVPDEASALAVQRAVVEARVAACVNRVPGLRSLFRWQGKLEHAEEELLLLKTRAGCWDRLLQVVREHHPHELPEILAVRVEDGLAGYLQWVREETR